MGKKCFVPYCTTGSKYEKEKVSVFKAPNDNYMLEKWRKAIPAGNRVLTSNDHVCEKHFKAHYVTPRFQTSAKKDFIYYDLSRAKLSADAVPTIFAECVPDKNIKGKKYLKSFDQNMNANTFSKMDIESIEVSDSEYINICYKCLTGQPCTHVLLCD